MTNALQGEDSATRQVELNPFFIGRFFTVSVCYNFR